MVAMAGYDIPDPRHAPADRQRDPDRRAGRATDRRPPKGDVSVSEITGMEGEQIQMHDLFMFEQTGVDADGHATGRFVCHRHSPADCASASNISVFDYRLKCSVVA